MIVYGIKNVNGLINLDTDPLRVSQLILSDNNFYSFYVADLEFDSEEVTYLTLKEGNLVKIYTIDEYIKFLKPLCLSDESFERMTTYLENGIKELKDSILC